MSYDIISIDSDIKHFLKSLKKEKSWNKFFREDVIPKLE